MGTQNALTDLVVRNRNAATNPQDHTEVPRPLPHILYICRHHFLTCVKEGDFCEGKVANLKETKRYIRLESADGSPSDGPGEYSTKMLISPLWYSADGELPMKSRKEKRIRNLRKS